MLIKKFPTIGKTAHHHFDDILSPERARRDDHDFLANQNDFLERPIKSSDDSDQENEVTYQNRDNHDHKDDFHTFNDHNTDNRNGTIDHGWTRRELKIVTGS